MLTTLLTVALSTTLSIPSTSASDDIKAPPGLVFLKKERVVIGLDNDAAKETILATDGIRVSIWGETPAHKAPVDDFFLMSTEVTNEQFAEYILEAGSMPPELWAESAISTARTAFLTEQGKARQEAREAGKPIPEKEVFDSDTWWRLNWQDAEWEVPKELASVPVIQVNYNQAESYARWAGLRLMTEQEFQRAVRGKTENLYPWGANWDETKALSADNARDRLEPVGTRREGATLEGIYDLPGGVWEWTSSKYLPYPKFKAKTLTMGKGASKKIINLTVEWDEAQKVLVGGSYKNGGMAARATTRRPGFSDETTDAIGFRCAASPTVGSDIAMLVEKADVGRSIRGQYKFDLSLTVATDRWKYRKGEAGKIRKGDKEKKEEDWSIENYAVITNYDYVLFSPVAELNSSNPTVLGKKTISEGPLILGFMSTTLPISNPALEPGTYMVGWRAAGKNHLQKAPKAEGDDEEGGGSIVTPLEDQIEFDHTVENLVFMDKNGTPLLAVPFKGITSERLREGTIATNIVEADERKKIVAHEELIISAVVPAGRRGFLFDIKLECPVGTSSGNWRK